MTKALHKWHSTLASAHLVLCIGGVVVCTTQFRLHSLHNPVDLTSAARGSPIARSKVTRLLLFTRHGNATGSPLFRSFTTVSCDSPGQPYAASKAESIRCDTCPSNAACTPQQSRHKATCPPRLEGRCRVQKLLRSELRVPREPAVCNTGRTQAVELGHLFRNESA